VPATYRDIQQMTGLSFATISKYFNGGNLLARNRRAIEEASAALNFRVNEFARGLRTRRSQTVGVLLAELNSSFNTSIIARVEEILRAHGYGTIICDCRSDRSGEAEAVEFLLGKMIDGLIAIPLGNDGSVFAPAVERGVPVVLIDRLTDGFTTDSVIVDNAAASRTAVDELVLHGHRRIAILSGPDDIFTMRERTRGFQQALEEHGIEPCADYLVTGDMTVDGGSTGIKRVLDLDEPPTAVFCVNYELTLGAVIALTESKIKFPEAVSLVGFDNLMLTRIVTPRPTMVVQPIGRIAEVAAELVLKRMVQNEPHEPRIIVLPTELVRGESVGTLATRASRVVARGLP